MDSGEVAPGGFAHAPSGADVAAALFAKELVEWNRLPHFQDVTLRLVAQDGVLNGMAGELYVQGEAATTKVALRRPFGEYHLFCSRHNLGASEVANELTASRALFVKGSEQLSWTDNEELLEQCDHMLVLLDGRTWTSGARTAKLVEQIDRAMELGVHVACAHESPSLVGPSRHACDFSLMFRDDWTPPHLQSGAKGLYKEIAVSLKAGEWRKPGLVALAARLPMSGMEAKRAGASVMRDKRAQKHSNEERGILRVRLERASGLLAADSNGLSDPFAEVSVGWNKVASSVVDKSLDPKWNEDLELRGTFGELCGSLKVALFDKDPIKWSDGLGEVSVDLSALRTRSSIKFSKQPLSTQGSVSFTASWVKDKPPLPRLEDDPRFAEESVLGTGVVNSNLPLPICLVDSHAAAFSLADATKETQGESKLVERLLPPFLILMFLLYPVVTNIAFEGFPCYTLEGGQGWLIADVTIECGASEEHAHAVLLAWLAVFLYPVGLMVLNLVLLLWAHHAIIQK